MVPLHIAMKIQHQTKTKLELGGVAGTLRWMVALLLIGGAIMTSCGIFALKLWQEEGPVMFLVPVGSGVLIGLALFGVGLVQLFASERLILDRSAGRGSYESNSPIVTTEKPFKFKLTSINSIVITQETVEAPVALTQSGMSESTVCKAVLRVTKPRRAVTLDETQNGRVERVTKIAEQVADFLGETVEWK
jgi:hypothetical protein|tara:strand:+ start:1340 stop:1912 length:573 start_codon:yes stop_codon:yes gene_type:complete